MKKLLLFTGSLTSVIAPVATVVACDSKPAPVTTPMTELTPADYSDSDVDLNLTPIKPPTINNHCLDSSDTSTGATAPTGTGSAMMPISHSIKDVVNAVNGDYYAYEYRSLWRRIQWVDTADHTKGVSLVSGKSEAKLQKTIKDSYCLVEDFYTKGSISWSTVKNAYTKSGKTDAAIDDLKTKLMANLDAITDAVNKGIENIKGAALMKLALQFHELLSKYPPLITLSWGGDSGNVKNFAIPALVDQKPNNITVSDEKTLMDYYKVALSVLLTN